MHGYKDIAFESDFFGLLFDHNKRNLYGMWSSSDQCRSLMEFLEQNKVTIWGFDNRIYSYYSAMEFTHKLAAFLHGKNIEPERKFLELSNTILKNEYKSRELLSADEISYLKGYLAGLLAKEEVTSDKLWKQILESYQSSIDLYTIKDNNNDVKRIAIRDRQMAKNLDFLVRQNPGRKFIVWLANAHMSKCDDEAMKGKTMGAQFRQLNPNSSYHIAFGSIKMPPERSDKSIANAAKNSSSILHYLPSVTKNYFVDAHRITTAFPEYSDKIFSDSRIFNMGRKTNLLSHFDALVFLAGGIEVTYPARK